MTIRSPVPIDDTLVPAFTPVPRRPRSDGWDAARQQVFIAALAKTGSVTDAARAAGMSREGAYQLRLAPDAASFRAAWAAALDVGVQSLADAAIERARNGTSVPIFYHGAQVGERRHYDNRLLQFILRHHMPDRYGSQISRGTRSRDTIEREAADNCPVCRANRVGGSVDPADPWLDAVLDRYLIKVQQEQRERRAGRWYAADFYLRQLTHLELILDLGGRSAQLLETVIGSAPGVPERYASPLSEHLAQRRADYWATTDRLPRPPVRRPATVTEGALLAGDTLAHRQAARTRCERLIAAAQDEWEAARTEDSWIAWCQAKGRDPVNSTAPELRSP